MSSHEKIELIPGIKSPLNPEFTAVEPYMLSGMRMMVGWGVKHGIIKDPMLYTEETVQNTRYYLEATQHYDPSYFKSAPLQVMVTGEYAPSISRNTIFAGTRVILQAPDLSSVLDVSAIIKRPLTKYPDILPISIVRFFYVDAVQEIDYVRAIGGVGTVSYDSPKGHQELTIGVAGIPLGYWPNEMSLQMRAIIRSFDVAITTRIMKGLIDAGTPLAPTVEEHERRIEELLGGVVPAR